VEREGFEPSIRC